MEFSFETGIAGFEKIMLVVASLFHISKPNKAKLQRVALLLLVTGSVWRNCVYGNLWEFTMLSQKHIEKKLFPKV